MVFECGGPSYSDLKAMDMAEYAECVAARELYLQRLDEERQRHGYKAGD